MKNLNLILVILLLIIGAILLFGKKDSTSDGDIITDIQPVISAGLINEEGNVKVSVKSINESNTSFKIVLETHSVELSYDLLQLVSLYDEDGNEYFPTSWEGDAEGDHHREGVLKFEETILVKPSTLIIRNIDEVEERVFELST